VSLGLELPFAAGGQSLGGAGDMLIGSTASERLVPRYTGLSGEQSTND